MPLCGKTVAGICGLISTWGVIQLALTGLFSYLHSPALVEDIGIEERNVWTESELRVALDTGYQTTALNCWIASLLYFATLCVSAQQFWANHTAGDNQFKAQKF
jgi:hypothetical protein